MISKLVKRKEREISASKGHNQPQKVSEAELLRKASNLIKVNKDGN